MPQTTFRSLSITYHDEREYKTLIEEIFKKNVYYVDFDTDRPVIIDAGAHIGIATLYFRSLYPKAEVVCIEPNPQNLTYLRQNLAANSLDGITVFDKALVGSREKRTMIPLYTNNQWTVFSSLQTGGWTGEESGKPVLVGAMKLSSLLTRPIDLLKLDIEGAETDVLLEAGQKLSMVRHLICEFHKTEKHHEDQVLKILKQHFKTTTVTVDTRKEKNPKNKLLLIESS